MPTSLPVLAAASLLVAVPALADADDDVCAAGARAVENGDDVTAFVALEACLHHADVGNRAAIRKALASATARLESGQFAEVSFAVEPADAVITVVGAIAFPVRGDATIFLPWGRHPIRVARDGFAAQSTEIAIEDRKRKTIVLRLSPLAEREAADGSIDFTEEPPEAPETTRPQTPAEFESLIPKSYEAGRPRGEMERPRRSARWPWALASVGLGLGVAGAVLHVKDRQGLALGFYLGGALALGGGAVALSLTRVAPSASTDPEISLAISGIW